jgi:hydrogenase expression/formation protein HypE
MHALIAGRFAPAFAMEGGVADAAVLDLPPDLIAGGRLAFTTDSYVVSPLFFPGGSIGDLAVYGTVNDLAVSGARPLWLTAAFVIEEGFALRDLDRIVADMARAASRAGVRIVAGDTKVVGRGKGDGVFITTAGVGAVPVGVELGPARMVPGDALVLSGSIGRHGAAVMGERMGISFDPPVMSDTAPLHELAASLLDASPGGEVRVMRDPTRGGLATTLKEFALGGGRALAIEEERLPVEPGVRGACELLGLDPLYVANEGLLLAVVKSDVAEYLCGVMRQCEAGRHAVVVGRVEEGPPGLVRLETAAGGSRVVEMLQGEQLPRIC